MSRLVKFLLALAVLGTATACQQPTQPTQTPNDGGNQNQNVVVNVGGSNPSPNPSGSCSNVDSVSEQVPPSIDHGTPVAISLSATLGGQNVPLGQACGAAAWLVQVPCFVANTAAAKTTLDSSAVDLSGCSVQGCVGNVCAAPAIVVVN
jgi:hypothetical protein